MDAKTKEILEALIEKEKSNKPFWLGVAQAVVIGIIMSVPTILLLANKVENRIIEQKKALADESRERRQEDDKIKTRADFNFNVIVRELNDGTTTHEIHIIPLNESR